MARKSELLDARELEYEDRQRVRGHRKARKERQALREARRAVSHGVSAR